MPSATPRSDSRACSPRGTSCCSRTISPTNWNVEPCRHGEGCKMKRLSVGVIFGGRSVEHDVSIVTAHQVMAALSEHHDVVPLYVTRQGRWLTSPGLNDLEVYKNERWDDVGEEGFIA